nr:DUF3265 domain-containing protein [Vibrio harveyi]
MRITNYLRVIRNAWHLCYVFRQVFKMGGCIALLSP